MGGGSSGGGGGTSIQRYADYIELSQTWVIELCNQRIPSRIDASPYAGHVDTDIDAGFFGAGYTLSSFMSLYSFYSQYGINLDLDNLFSNLLMNSSISDAVSNLIAAEADLLDDDIEENVIPRFECGMRNINAVQSSTFVIGKALIEAGRVKALAKTDAQLRTQMITVAVDAWKSKLQWYQNLMMNYAQLLKFYYSAKMDFQEHDVSFHHRDLLWPFTVLEFLRLVDGTLQGAISTYTGGGPSGTQKAIGGALGGAATGAVVGSVVPGIGTVTGAIVGGVLGLASSFL